MSSRRQGPNFHHNHLIHEKSPYLLQHAENPVDWYPWGPEAFQKAREEGKPVFLSIGYATCHWCHVMAHESFEDEEVSDLLNESFVAVKVDREERPDIDHLYMSVCQGLTGQGGWPLSIFMTPEGNPFFAGTYFPKSGRMGMTGFTDLLIQIANLWKNDREKLLKSGEGIRQALQQQEAGTEKGGPALDQKALQKSYIQLSRAFDPLWGGFSQAPKFPTPHQMNFLLRWGKRSGDSQAGLMVEKTLQAMRQGGIFDQIGLGFHRYSVDEKWLVPHFEKMLYDQAMLAMSYLEAYQALGKSDYAETAREIFTYVLRDMTSPEGGFYSAEDADSEGREGLFYVWTPREIKKHLGEDLGNLFCRFYDITPGGNFEDGTSIPHISRPLAAFAQTENIPLPELTQALEEGREKLLAAREKRIHPLKDDKIITSWNGLMIAALAKGYQALQDPAYARAAKKAADFILGRMVKDGRLMRRFRHGHIAHPGFLDDYAFFIWGLLELYEATFEFPYLAEASRLNQIVVELFWDEKQGGFFYSGKDSERLITRMKDLYDGAIPSGNSVAALNLLRLSRLTGNVGLEEMADRMLRTFAASMGEYPMAYTQFLNFLDFVVGPSQEIVICGDPQEQDGRAIISWIQQKFLPNKVMLLKSAGPGGKDILNFAPFTKEMQPIQGKTAVYICSAYACQKPVTELEDLAKILP